MAEEATQRHTTESAKPPAAHHRASPQDDIPLPKKQPRRHGWSSRQERLTLATVVCLLVGIWYIWATRDLLGFILLYGISTGAINAREVVGKMLPDRTQQGKRKHSADDGEREQGDGDHS